MRRLALANGTLIALVCLLVPALCARGADPEKAKKKLAGMDYEPTEKGFVKAANDGDKKAVALFLEAGISPNGKGSSGDTPIITAAESGHAEVVGMLVKAGADVNARNSSERSALYYAVQGSGGLDPQGKTLDALLAAPGVDLKTPYKHGASLLHLAVESDHDVGITKLLAKGLDPNTKDDNQQTPLAMAASYGRKKAMPALLKAPGVDLNARDKDGETPLLSAAEGGEVEAGLALLKAGADAKATSKDGSNALHKVCSVSKHNREQFKVPEDKYLAFLDAVIAAGVPVDAKRKNDGATPLAIAAPEGHVPTIKELLAKGANPNLASASGETPLLVAARDGHATMVKALLDGKADPNVRDRTGRSALTLARDYPEVAELLKAAGAKESGAPKPAAAKKKKA
jgi:ankyrin repeat protein